MWRKQRSKSVLYDFWRASKNLAWIFSSFERLLGFDGPIILAERKGITQMAYRKLHDRVMKIAQGNIPTKSPKFVPFINDSMGKNIKEMEQVAMSIEVIKLLVETEAEYQRECPELSMSV